MSDDTHPVQPGPTSIGELLSNAFRMYRNEPMMFILLTAITVIPVGIISAFASNAVSDAETTGRAAAILLTAVVPAVLLLPISGAAIPIAPRSTKFSSTANASSPTSKAMTGRAGVMVCVVMLAPGACLRRAILWGVSAKVTHGRPPGTDRGTPLPFAAPFQANCRLGHTQTTECRPRQVA